MAQQYISIGITGQQAQDIINGNFTELYNGATKLVKYSNQSANFTATIPANAYAWKIFLQLQSGSPTVRIGTTPNGTDILPDVSVTSSDCPGNSSEIPVKTSSYPLYFTITGTGAINATIFEILNVF
jgi:hypothetical protein